MAPLQGLPATAPPQQPHHQRPGARGDLAAATAHAAAQRHMQQRPPAKTGAPLQGAAVPQEEDEAPVSVPPVLAKIWDQSPGYAGEVQALREIEELRAAAKKLALATAAQQQEQQQQQHELSAC